MRFRTVLFLSSLYLLCFTVAAWSSTFAYQPTSSGSAAVDTKSISGKIAAVGDSEFSLEVPKAEKPATFQIQIDNDTQLEGTLAVGAQATVDYRTTDGKMIATHVVVTPASGVGLR
jgi:hypothetical protein